MKTLLLTSAGMQVKEEILEILPKSPSQTKVAHVVTASKGEKDTSYVVEDTKTMEGLGFQVESIDIEGSSEDELRKLFERFDIIYVQGGNTFYLLKAVRESGFDKVVKEFIEQGKIYIGVSAGSILMGPTIETANWGGADRNEAQIKDLNGLNFVPFLISPHYTKGDEELLKREISKWHYPVRFLTDAQAFLIQDDTITLVGKGAEIKL